MQSDRPIGMSIAGWDPSAGAGLAADIKTFEQHRVYGLGICTAQTVQTESEFLSVRWEKTEDVIYALEKMLLHYDVQAVKIGITENVKSLDIIVNTIFKVNNTIPIIVDPVISSSTGFTFWQTIEDKQLNELLSKIFLLTPNYDEILHLTKSTDAQGAAEILAKYCNVLLKGGHSMDEPGIDYLFSFEGKERIDTGNAATFAKHGSGCVLSSAITANLALGLSLPESCIAAKKYVEQFLNSSESLLGYHVQ
ncbi:hydroxymethylpyrimidine/phosphomethylpyrimidine kinase [soil metagenome]